MRAVETKRADVGGLFDSVIVDNFAGGGGASLGLEWGIGRAVDIAINHDPAAILMHAQNHPHTRHLRESVFNVDPREVCGGRRVGAAWFSPDCTHFSKAKGSKPLKKSIRGLAWVVLRWAGTVRPDLIMLENVEEFQKWGPLNRNRRPVRARIGETFRRWVSQLQALGYAVEWRILNAADHGAPTFRKRLFVVARCDGRPICWPTPTHGPGRRHPYRTAAECIDWSLPCPSIFDRKKPLAEKTQRRIAMGLVRFVLNNPRPFIVRCDHGGEHFRGQSIDQPLSTVTQSHGYGVVAPTFVECANAKWTEGVRAADRPIATLTASPRGGSWALVSAFLAKHYSGVVGQPMAEAIGTVTAKDHHSLVAAHLTKFNGTGIGQSPAEPLHTITGGGKKFGLVAAFLLKYYGQGGQWQKLDEPLHTIVSRARYGLVTVTIEGEEYVLADIGLRMLEPFELALCQSFPKTYILPRVKSQATRFIGNSVPPVLACAVARANTGGELDEVAA